MNIAPVNGDGPTPDQEEMSKTGGPAPRGWLHGFWDCLSDPATCCFGIPLQNLLMKPTAAPASCTGPCAPPSPENPTTVSRMVACSVSPASVVLLPPSAPSIVMKCVRSTTLSACTKARLPAPRNSSTARLTMKSSARKTAMDSSLYYPLRIC